MTASDEVRRMLDERDVEWEDGGEGLTIIPAQDGVPQAWTVNTWPSGKDMGDCLWVQNRHPLTPEQAIATTLGSCNCTNNCTNSERTETCRIENRNGDWYCTGCGEVVGTCDTASELCIDGNAIELWHFCPNCGRKVVDE